MTPPPGRRGLHAEQAGEVTVVRFTLSEILHIEVIESVGDQLFALVDDEGRRRLLLDFRGVRKVSSALLGKLIALHRRLLTLDGQMALCGVEPEVYKIFALCQLPRLLHIYQSAEEARHGLLGSQAPIESGQ
jgi:anti-sigma B factor antagonist